MAVKNLEKQIYEKFMTRASDYDHLCDQICKVFKYLIQMKYLSRHIRNKGFSLTTMMKLTNKDRAEIKKIDAVAKSKLERVKTENHPFVSTIDDINEKLSSSGLSDKDQVFSGREENSKSLFSLTNSGKNLGKRPKLVKKNNFGLIGIGQEELHFSNSDSDSDESQLLENGQEGSCLSDGEEICPKPQKHVKTAHALCYDPETKQYEINEDKLVTDSESQHMFYKIYSDSINFHLKDGEGSRKLDNLKCYSCTGHEFIRYFSEIPPSVTLTTQLTVFEFEQYMQKVLLSEQALNYVVLPLWVDCNTPLASRNYFRSNNCVASMQYSKRCKLFIFPKEFLRQDWLTTLNFYVVHNPQTQIELVGFVVLKLVDCTSYEVTIIPEKVTLEKSHKVYKLVRNQGEVCEKNLDSSILMERHGSDAMGHMGTHDGHYHEAGLGVRGGSSRLFEDLIDSGLADGSGKGFISGVSKGLVGGHKNFNKDNFGGKSKKNYGGSKLQKLMGNGGNGGFAGGFGNGFLERDGNPLSNTSSSNQLVDEDLQIENVKTTKNYETDLLGTLKMGSFAGREYNAGARGNISGNLPNMHHHQHQNQHNGVHGGHNSYFNKSEQYNPGHHNFGPNKPNLSRSYGNNNLLSALNGNPSHSNVGMFRKTENHMFRNTETDDFGMSEENLSLNKISPFSKDDLEPLAQNS
jgi:hypothetical protein